jgi:hypothetical protein
VLRGHVVAILLGRQSGVAVGRDDDQAVHHATFDAAFGMTASPAGRL